MTPLGVRSAARGTWSHLSFSHGAVIENVNWVTLGTSCHGVNRRCCTDAWTCKLRDALIGLLIAKDSLPVRRACRASCSLRYLSRQLITNCGRSRGKTFCSLACFWQPSTLSFSFALFAANS